MRKRSGIPRAGPATPHSPIGMPGRTGVRATPSGWGLCQFGTLPREGTPCQVSAPRAGLCRFDSVLTLRTLTQLRAGVNLESLAVSRRPCLVVVHLGRCDGVHV